MGRLISSTGSFRFGFLNGGNPSPQKNIEVVKNIDRKHIAVTVPVRWAAPYPEPVDTGPSKFPKPDGSIKKFNAYQAEASRWVRERTPPRSLIADEQGLGKTATALRALRGTTPNLVVCPASLRLNWRNECLDWRPDIEPLVPPPGEFWVPNDGQLVIVSYESLPEPYGSKRFLIPDPRLSSATLLVDEAHRVKNPRRQRSKKVRLLSQQCAMTVGLTGTPLLGKPQDLWGLLWSLGLEQVAFGSWDKFISIFGGEYKVVAKKRGPDGELRTIRQWEFDDEPDERIYEHLSRVMIRRTRAEVMPHLAKKEYELLHIEVGDSLAAQLDDIDREWAALNLEDDELPPFEMMSTIRAALAKSRVPAMLEQVSLFEEKGVPLLVFSSHLDPIRALAGRPGWGIITGETHPDLRQSIVDAFQNGMLQGVGLTIQAGGVGLTLTKAATELFVDRSYTPAENDQAEDRAVRIGQEAASVRIIHMVSDHPLDKRLNEILMRKQKLIAATVKPMHVRREEEAE